MAVSAELLTLLGIDTSNGEDEVLYGDDFLLGAISGGAGDDYVEGKGGLDLLTGGTGSDTVGYSESDVGVHIDLGNLLLGLLGAWGGDADGDVLVNGFENVVGSAHADDISGDGGANILVGLEDADRLDGSGGDDTLIGGTGADVLIGDTGSDTASYALAVTGVTVSLSTGTGTAGEASGDTLTGIENLTGSAFADVLEGNALANRIQAGAGDDTIIGTDGLDVIDGGDGNDTLDFGGATAGITLEAGGDSGITSVETITGSDYGDTITFTPIAAAASFDADLNSAEVTSGHVDGGSGNDQIYITGVGDGTQVSGGAGSDTLVGGSGSETFDGGVDHDVMQGGGGNDVFNWSDGADDYSGDEGDDTLIIRATDAESLPLSASAASAENFIDGGTFWGGSGHNVIRWEENSTWSNGVLLKILSSTSSLALADDGADIEAYNEDDEVPTVLEVNPSETSDTSSLEAAGDELHTAAASDSSTMIEGTNLDDTIEDSTVFNWIFDGRGGNDRIAGGSGDNVIRGGEGNDTLYGGGGDDLVEGGAGADAMYGDDGLDTAQYLGSSEGVLVHLSGGSVSDPGRAEGGDAEGDNHVAIENLTGSLHNDNLEGDSVDNVIRGDGGDDDLGGLAGNDILEGGAGSDSLYGEDGEDVLDGGDGGDTLRGGNDADVLTGGAGADIFQYAGISGSTPALRDQITDFSRAEGDKIDLSQIDANSSAAGDQAFRFIGSAQFGGQAGQLRAVADNSVEGFNTRIAVDVTGDGTADLAVMVNVVGGGALVAADFVL